MPRGHPSGTSSASEAKGVGHWRAVVRSKDSCPVRRGAVGKVPKGNSLAAYSTARTVLRGGSGGNAAPLPDRRRYTMMRVVVTAVVLLSGAFATAGDKKAD